jgi:protoporphyrinogen oxidase
MTVPASRTHAHSTTLIAGAGLAGLSAAWHLRNGGHGPVRVVEALDRVGGVCTTERKQASGGHVFFDQTGHYLHLRHPHIRAWVTELLGTELAEYDRVSLVHSHGVFTDYPYQANNWGLPPEVVAENLTGYFAARDALLRRAPGDEPNPTSFADWVLTYLGEGFARNFMFPYNRKLWQCEPEAISHAWCQRFVPKPAPADIIRGAVGLTARRMGYNARFLYPRSGGIDRLPNALAGDLARRFGQGVELEAPITRLSVASREATLASGEVVPFGALISTMALPRLVSLIDDAPAEVQAASAKLKATSVVYINVIATAWRVPVCHWFYVPEPTFRIHRVGCYSHIDPSFAPAGTFACYVERSHNGPYDAAQFIREAIDDLVGTGVIAGPHEVVSAEARQIETAYVVYDHAYAEARATIHAWLAASGIQSIGRWGDWNYSAMEDALVDGERAAQAVLQRS